MERFNIKNLKEGDVKEQYQFTIRNRSAVLENLQDNGDGTSIQHGTILDRTSPFRPKRV
jgi:hypothetical protein